MARRTPAKTRAKGIGTCMECRHAWLMGDGRDPVIARCLVDGERQVARIHRCTLGRYESADDPPDLHEMEYL